MEKCHALLSPVKTCQFPANLDFLSRSGPFLSVLPFYLLSSLQRLIPLPPLFLSTLFRVNHPPSFDGFQISDPTAPPSWARWTFSTNRYVIRCCLLTFPLFLDHLSVSRNAIIPEYPSFRANSADALNARHLLPSFRLRLFVPFASLVTSRAHRCTFSHRDGCSCTTFFLPLLHLGSSLRFLLYYFPSEPMQRSVHRHNNSRTNLAQPIRTRLVLHSAG